MTWKIIRLCIFDGNFDALEMDFKMGNFRYFYFVYIGIKEKRGKLNLPEM